MRGRLKAFVTLLCLATASLCALISQSWAASAALKWKYQAGDIYFSPAIGSNGAVYVLSADSYLYAVGPDGTLKWKHQTGSEYTAISQSQIGLAVGPDGTVYAGPFEGILYAISSTGTLKWKYDTGIMSFSYPSVGSDGTVYMGSWDGLHALDSGGSLKWKFSTGSSVNYHPAVGPDGTVYVGGFDSDKCLFAVNSDGALKWKYKTESLVLSSPAVGPDGVIYAGTSDKNLHAVNPDGTLKWKFAMDGITQSLPVIGPDGVIYVGAYDNYLYALNPDGTLKWKYKPDDAALAPFPSIGRDGSIYAAFNTRSLYALNPDGTLKWTYETGLTLDFLHATPAVGRDGTIYAGSAMGSQSYLYAISDSEITLAEGLDVWNDWFAVDVKETPMVGDFNGDGRTDIITFTRDNPSAVGDVYVSLSNGEGFSGNDKWNDWFAIDQDETIVIGDFNGDGKDDIATWLGKSTKQIYVATSHGSGMNESALWLDKIGDSFDDVLKAADADGDGKRDLVLFSRHGGQVYVALSTGAGFDSPQVWHTFFAVSTYERPEAGDVDGDGRADIITFASDSPTAQGDVYVALSTGSKFGDGQTSDKWNDWFAVDSAQKIRVGDMNGDGTTDFGTFLPDPNNQVYAVYSRGSYMSENYLVTSDFPETSTDQPFLGDANGDGKADLFLFRQGEGKVYVMLTP